MLDLTKLSSSYVENSLCTNPPHHSPRGPNNCPAHARPPPPSTQASQSSFGSSALAVLLPGVPPSMPPEWQLLTCQLSSYVTSAERPSLNTYPLGLHLRQVAFVTQSCAISFCVRLMVICPVYCMSAVPVLTCSLPPSVTSVRNGACHTLGSYM